MGKEQPLVKPEASLVQYPKDNHHALSGIIAGVGIFHHHKFILLGWCPELKGNTQNHHYQRHDDYYSPRDNQNHRTGFGRRRT